MNRRYCFFLSGLIYSISIVYVCILHVHMYNRHFFTYAQLILYCMSHIYSIDIVLQSIVLHMHNRHFMLHTYTIVIVYRKYCTVDIVYLTYFVLRVGR